MASKTVTITTSEWTLLTAKGESGTVWKKAGNGIVVDHMSSTAAAAATLPTSSGAVTIAKSKRVPLDKDDNDTLAIPADDSNDVYYGIGLGDNAAGAEMTLAVDVI